MNEICKIINTKSNKSIEIKDCVMDLHKGVSVATFISPDKTTKAHLKIEDCDNGEERTFKYISRELGINYSSLAYKENLKKDAESIASDIYNKLNNKGNAVSKLDGFLCKSFFNL